MSVPSSMMYNHYTRHCRENKVKPGTQSSFGKGIRTAFGSLLTRRFGARGNSKYHYCGIRVKLTSPLNQLSEVGQQPASQKPYKFPSGSGQMTDDNQCEQGANTSTSNHLDLSASLPQHPLHDQYLGGGAWTIREFPNIELSPDLSLPGDSTLEDVDKLRSIYLGHCEEFLDAIVNLEFHMVENVLQDFWRTQDKNNGDECKEGTYLTKNKLYLLCKLGPVQQFVRTADYLFYQNLVGFLIPDVLGPISHLLTEAYLKFAKSLELWLTMAMSGCPAEMVQVKVIAVKAFAQTLCRRVSLNHMAKAAEAIFQNPVQINEMLDDLNGVDFHCIQEQASRVCQCDDAVVESLMRDFKISLYQQTSLALWAAWLKRVVTDILKPHQGTPIFKKSAREFLLKWSFYSSIVIRDLTLRNAASLTSFHVIRMFYDEYMVFLIEHQVAEETGETPIALIGDKIF